MIAKLIAALLVVQASSLPQKRNIKIDWDNLQARYPTVMPWTGEWPPEILSAVVNLGPPTSYRHPEYKKGTLDLSGECGMAAPPTTPAPETTMAETTMAETTMAETTMAETTMAETTMAETTIAETTMAETTMPESTMSGGERIVGGSEAEPHSYPWMAALFVDGSWFCGGSLISDEWVLTAAHCAKDASEMVVMLGAHNVREEQEEGRIELTTTDFFTHPDYNTFTLHNDLALVHLPRKVEFTDTIRPVCLPAHSESGEKFDHLPAVASGWGKPTDSAESISPELRFVDTDTITNLICALEFPANVWKNIICISGKNGKSTCNGDSGGPLHLVNDGVHKQIGITSFGSGLGCELGFHAAFTRPASYLEWIETETNVMIQP